MALAQWVITVLMDLSSAVLTSTQTTSQQRKAWVKLDNRYTIAFDLVVLMS